MYIYILYISLYTGKIVKIFKNLRDIDLKVIMNDNDNAKKK